MLSTLTALAFFLAFCDGVALLRHMRKRPYRPYPTEFEEPPRVSTRIWDGTASIINEKETP